MSVLQALEFDLVHWLNDSVGAAILTFHVNLLLSLKDQLQNLVRSYHVVDIIPVAAVFTLVVNKINPVVLELKFQRVEKDN